MSAAVDLAERGRGRTSPNPNVGCVIVRGNIVVGRGWTQPGGRPHAEAMALVQAGALARGATLYVTLEPCAHPSARGATCSDSIGESGIVRVVAAMRDPDPRTDGQGFAGLKDSGVEVEVGVGAVQAERAMAGFLMRRRRARPHVTLKLAVSLDGSIAMANGTSRWITGEAARRHAHVERARSDAIVVGRGTYDADAPRLDVRLPGLEDRAPVRVMLTGGAVPPGWVGVGTPEGIATLAADWLLIEGGAGAASAFLAADLVDRLLIYRAPILIGGRSAVHDIGLGDLSAAHGRWCPIDSRMLGSDRLDVYDRFRE